MIHRLILSTFSLLSVMTCQNQKVETTAENTKTTTPSVIPKQNTTPVNTEKTPEMSVGLPPDKAAVKQAQDETNLKAAQNGIIYLNEGENKFLKEYGMNITFKKMIEDSRCPEGVNCIWAGVATAEIEVMGVETRPMKIKISTMQDASKGYFASQNFNGYQIEMANLTPYPKADQGLKSLEGKYKIGIKIRKGSGASQGTTTK